MHRSGCRRQDPRRRRRHRPVPRRSHLASWNATAPIDASSSEHASPAVPRREPAGQTTSTTRPASSAAQRHRTPPLLSAPAGRWPDPMEAMRCLRRRPSDVAGGSLPPTRRESRQANGTGSWSAAAAGSRPGGHRPHHPGHHLAPARRLGRPPDSARIGGPGSGSLWPRAMANDGAMNSIAGRDRERQLGSRW